MIKLYMMGGLGNLMFQYSFARILGIKSKENIIINSAFMTYANIKFKRNNIFHNGLINLNINNKIKIINPIIGLITAIPTLLEYLFLKKDEKNIHGKVNYEKLIKKGKYYIDDADCLENIPISNKKNKKIIGYFANYDFFIEYKDLIKDELKVIKEPTIENKKLIDELCSCNSVCVHIRRGDYISVPENKDFIVCNENYYKIGMKYIYEKEINPVFYIFSNNNDDINWIKTNYNFEYPVKYITLNNPDYEELRLMYSCKHFIISNSSFSWWGSFLSENHNKISIAPFPWTNSKKEWYISQKGIYREDMTIIDVNTSMVKIINKE